MNFHPGGDLVLGQAEAEFNSCLLSGRRFSRLSSSRGDRSVGPSSLWLSLLSVLSELLLFSDLLLFWLPLCLCLQCFFFFSFFCLCVPT